MCDFGINWQAGQGADLSFVPRLRFLARLEGFTAAQALEQGRVADAAKSLRVMFRLAWCLDRQRPLVCRLQAAHTRREALLVLERIAQQEEPPAAALADMVQAQLDDWPHDADAWIADRAMSLHTYELARVGELLSVLTAEERQTLTQDGRLARLGRYSSDDLDRDERTYLRHAACD